MVVVDFDIDVDRVAPEVNDPVDYLIGHYCGTKQHQQCPKQPPNDVRILVEDKSDPMEGGGGHKIPPQV